MAWRRVLLLLVLALAVGALGACGGDDDDDGGDTEAAFEELSGTLPTADELGLTEVQSWEWEDGSDLVTQGLVIGGDSDEFEVGAAIDDAGFQTAAGSDLEGDQGNVRLRAIQFDSDDGALEARDLLHEEDLKTPCPKRCIVTPLPYELETDIPDSTAVHHVPTDAELGPGESPVEAHHAEFPVGSVLYVVQMDGPPSKTFTDDFEEVMGTVYESASAGE